MSEEGINSLTASPCTPTTDSKKLGFYQSHSTYFQITPSLAKRCHESSPDAIPVPLQGSKTSKLVIGRGNEATVKIGRSNKRVSREHVAIEHKPHLNGFEMTILSPNGALIDHIIFDQGEHVPIVEGTIIEIVGNKMIFRGPKEEEEEREEEMPDIPIPTVVATTTTMVTTTTTTTTTATTTTVIEEEKLPIPTNTNMNNDVNLNTSKANNNDTTQNISAKKPMSLEDEIIQVLVYSKKSTMTCTDITSKINGQTFLNVINFLTESPVIGCVPRSGKTADGSLKEDLYYYKPELDSNVERRNKHFDVGRSARKCTMKDTQYFFRIPPKLPAHKTSNNKIRKRTNHAREKEEDEELKSNSSDDVSDMEVYELFKDV